VAALEQGLVPWWISADAPSTENYANVLHWRRRTKSSGTGMLAIMLFYNPWDLASLPFFWGYARGRLMDGL